MATETLVNCPLCKFENHLAHDGAKIVDCRSCGAPIFNPKRPTSGSDLSNYQEKLRQWGEEDRKISKEHVKAHAFIAEQKKQQQHADGQLKQENTKLRADLTLLQQDHAKEIEAYKAKAQRSSNTLQGEKEALAVDYAKAQQCLATLQAERETLTQLNEQLAHEKAILSSSVDELEEHFETYRRKNDGYIDHLEKEISKSLSQLIQRKKEWEAPILEKIEYLRSGLPSDAGRAQQVEQTETVQQTAASSDSRAAQKEKIENTTKPHTALKSQAAGAASIIISSTAEGEPAAGEPAEAAYDINQVSNSAPAWVHQYNALSTNRANLPAFKSAYRPTKLMIPRDILERRWTAFNTSEPVFFLQGTAGTGSYWLIESEAANHLVLDRDRFLFNNSNYRSINACYDFNEYDESTIKDFQHSRYNLSHYTIFEPAEVISTDEEGTWQLSKRGRIIFAPKPVELEDSNS